MRTEPVTRALSFVAAKTPHIVALRNFIFLEDELWTNSRH